MKRMCCCALFVCLLLIFSTVAVAIPTGVTPKKTEPVVRKFLVKSYGVNAFTGRITGLVPGSVAPLYRQEFGFSFPLEDAPYNAVKTGDARYEAKANDNVGFRFFIKQRFSDTAPPPLAVPVNVNVEVFDSQNTKIFGEPVVLPTAFLEGSQYPRGFNFIAPPCDPSDDRVEDYDGFINFRKGREPANVARYDALRQWYIDMSAWCRDQYAEGRNVWGESFEHDYEWKSNFLRKSVSLTSSSRRLVPGIYKVRWSFDAENKLAGDFEGGREQFQRDLGPGPHNFQDPVGHVKEFTLVINPAIDTYVNGNLNPNIQWVNAPAGVPAPGDEPTPPACTATGAETCNGLDDDCAGGVDNGLGSSTCGVGACQRTVQNCVGGVVQTCTAGTPAASETCGDGIDNNCAGGVDEGCGAVTDTTPPQLTLRITSPTATQIQESGATINRLPAGTWQITFEMQSNEQASCSYGVKEIQRTVTDKPATLSLPANTAGNFQISGEVLSSGATPAAQTLKDNQRYQVSATCADASTNAGNIGLVFEIAAASTSTCTPPGTAEVCDGVDNDCDGSIDDGVKLTFYRDSDSDTFGDPAQSQQACTAPAGYVSNQQDCDDTKVGVKPGATEVCNGLDDDCAGGVDNGIADETTYPWSDNVARRAAPCRPQIKHCQGGQMTVTQTHIAPQTETCNTIDDDCNGQVDENLQDVVELCNNLDDNCDGTVDEACVTDACSAKLQEFDTAKAAFDPLKQPYINNKRPIEDYIVRCNSLTGDAQKQCWNELAVLGRLFEPLRIDFKNAQTLLLVKQVAADQACNRCLDADICGNDFDDNCDGKFNYGCKTAACFLAEKTFARVEQELTQLSTQAQAAPANRVLQAQLAELTRVRDEKRTAKDTACSCVSSAEVCDGRDNNCDGQIDEGLAVPLTCGVGACKRDFASACVDGVQNLCVPSVPQSENCKNGLDDDCDNSIDLDDTDCAACVQKITERGSLRRQHADKVVEHALAEFKLNNAKNACYEPFILHHDRTIFNQCRADAEAQFRPDVVGRATERDALATQITAINTNFGHCPLDSLYAYNGECLTSECIKTTMINVADPTAQNTCTPWAPRNPTDINEFVKFKALQQLTGDISVKLIGGEDVECWFNQGTASEHFLDLENDGTCHQVRDNIKIPKEKVLVGADKENTFKCRVHGIGRGRIVGFKLLTFQVPQ